MVSVDSVIRLLEVSMLSVDLGLLGSIRYFLPPSFSRNQKNHKPRTLSLYTLWITVSNNIRVLFDATSTIPHKRIIHKEVVPPNTVKNRERN